MKKTWFFLIKDSLRQLEVMDGCLKTQRTLHSNIATFLGLFNRFSQSEDSQELEDGVKILSKCPIYRYAVRKNEN